MRKTHQRLRHDLEARLDWFAAGKDPLYTHMAECPDGMLSHIKAAFTAAGLPIPFTEAACNGAHGKAQPYGSITLSVPRDGCLSTLAHRMWRAIPNGRELLDEAGKS